VLTVASSGIASLLLLGGKTTHSRFKILVALHDELTCNITQQMKGVEWTLRDLMQLDDAQATEKIFGGKIVVLGGDF
jgi:hypothetical protein